MSEENGGKDPMPAPPSVFLGRQRILQHRKLRCAALFPAARKNGAEHQRAQEHGKYSFAFHSFTSKIYLTTVYTLLH